MSRLSKAQAKAHLAACKLLEKDTLTEDDRFFVLDNWQESAAHMNGLAGAFFTPTMLARDFSIEVHPSGRIIDLCAGIGCLSHAVWCRSLWDRQPLELVCVERNPDYVAVGRKLLPHATWIEADVFDVPAMGLGRFDTAISNPPFGATPRDRQSPRYRGREFELHVIDIAFELADYGVFIVPQGSAPFEYSGKQHYQAKQRDGLDRLKAETGIELGSNCGIDCSVHADDWHGVKVAVEIVTAHFIDARAAQQPAINPEPDVHPEPAEPSQHSHGEPLQADLFGVAA